MQALHNPIEACLAHELPKRAFWNSTNTSLGPMISELSLVRAQHSGHQQANAVHYVLRLNLLLRLRLPQHHLLSAAFFASSVLS
jgi:hypothetical protein